MSEKGIIDQIIKEVRNIGDLLSGHLQTPGKFVDFIREFGWEIGSIDGLEDLNFSQFLNNLQIFKDKVEKFEIAVSDLDKLIALGELIKSIFDIVSSIYEFATFFEGIEGIPVSLANDLPRELAHYIILEYLKTYYPWIYFFLRVIGVANIEYIDASEDRLGHISREINFENLENFIRDPRNFFETLYQWGSDEFNIQNLLDLIEDVFLEFRVPTGRYFPHPAIVSNLLGIENPEFSDFEKELRVVLLEAALPDKGFMELGFSIFPLPPKEADGIRSGFALIPFLNGEIEIKIPLGSNIGLSINGDLSLGVAIEIVPENIKVKSNILGGTPQIDGSLEVKATIGRIDKKAPIVLLGNPKGQGVSINDLLARLGVFTDFQHSPDIFFEISIEGVKVKIGGEDADGFIQKILPQEGIESNFDLIVGWSSTRGLYFKGSATLEITIPIHKKLGPINIDTIYLAISTPNNGTIPITLAASFGAKIGPISANVKKIGFIANISRPDGGGNFGPLNFDLGFKWPTGVGLSINTSGLTGGGFLEVDQQNKRYVGILQLQFSDVGLLAITLITTKMPDGSKGFSMLSLINVTFNPAISLPYNFKLHGVGGLLGIQRTMKIDVIRDGLKNGILDSVMFPEGDIILRAPQIISDLRNIFPPTEGRYIIGLMAKLSWSELIYGDIGLFIEIPMPIKITILGQIYTYLPNEKAPIVEIHLDILGNLDLEQKKLYIMASIYNSRILKINLSGDAYIGVSWGNKPYFVLSLGGFHPKDKSIPSDVPALRRLMLSIGSGNNPRLSFETYFAITSATLGFGAKIELYAKKGRFSVEGYLGFDTLFIFSPFSFEVSLGAGIAVKAGGATLLSIALDMLLAGPTPWHAKGKAKFKILFFEIKVRFDVKWGKKEKATLPSVDPWPDLKQALEQKKSWGGVLPEGEQMPVLIRLNENTGTEIVVFPTGILEIRQNILPLGVKITKYKNTEPAGDQSQFDIKCISIIQSNDEESSIILDTDPTLDYFARPQYQEMSDSEKLSSPAYEKLESGKRCQAREISVDIKREYELVYETEVIDENKCARILDPSPCKWIMSKYLMKGGIAAFVPISNSGSAKYRVPVIMPKGELVEEAYAIVNTNDMTLVGSDEIPNNGNSTNVQTLQSMEEYLVNHPEKVGEIQIVPQSEVNTVNG